jgi:hypothetical protein
MIRDQTEAKRKNGPTQAEKDEIDKEVSSVVDQHAITWGASKDIEGGSVPDPYLFVGLLDPDP